MKPLTYRVLDPVSMPQSGTLEEALATGGLTLVEEISREELKRRYPDARIPEAVKRGYSLCPTCGRAVVATGSKYAGTPHDCKREVGR